MLGAWLLLAIASALAGEPASATVPVPGLDSAVIDTTGTLTADQRERIERRIAAFEQGGSQLQVLVVPTTADESIEQYATRAFEAWKLGRKGVDDGLLLVVAKDDRRARIEVGYGLEGAIPDIAAGRVLDEYVVPRFRRDDYVGGIEAGVDKLIALAAGEALPPASKRGDRGPNSNGIALALMLAAATLAGLAVGLGWLRWYWALGAAVLANAAAALLVAETGSLAIAAPWMLLTGYPLGWGLAKSGRVRRVAAVVVAVVAGLIVLGMAIGADKVLAGLGALLGLALVLGLLRFWYFLFDELRRASPVRLGIALALAAVAAVLSGRIALREFDAALPALALTGALSWFASLVLLVALQPGALSGGGGSGDDDDRSSGGGSGGGSSGGGGSRSGGGGSSGGGGASRSW